MSNETAIQLLSVNIRDVLNSNNINKVYVSTELNHLITIICTEANATTWNDDKCTRLFYEPSNEKKWISNFGVDYGIAPLVVNNSELKSFIEEKNLKLNVDLGSKENIIKTLNYIYDHENISTQFVTWWTERKFPKEHLHHSLTQQHNLVKTLETKVKVKHDQKQTKSTTSTGFLSKLKSLFSSSSSSSSNTTNNSTIHKKDASATGRFLEDGETEEDNNETSESEDQDQDSESDTTVAVQEPIRYIKLDAPYPLTNSNIIFEKLQPIIYANGISDLKSTVYTVTQQDAEYNRQRKIMNEARWGMMDTISGQHPYIQLTTPHPVTGFFNVFYCFQPREFNRRMDIISQTNRIDTYMELCTEQDPAYKEQFDYWQDKTELSIYGIQAPSKPRDGDDLYEAIVIAVTVPEDEEPQPVKFAGTAVCSYLPSMDELAEQYPYIVASTAFAGYRQLDSDIDRFVDWLKNSLSTENVPPIQLNVNLIQQEWFINVQQPSINYILIVYNTILLRYYLTGGDVANNPKYTSTLSYVINKTKDPSSNFFKLPDSIYNSFMYADQQQSILDALPNPLDMIIPLYVPVTYNEDMPVLLTVERSDNAGKSDRKDKGQEKDNSTGTTTVQELFGMVIKEVQPKTWNVTTYVSLLEFDRMLYEILYKSFHQKFSHANMRPSKELSQQIHKFLKEKRTILEQSSPNQKELQSIQTEGYALYIKLYAEPGQWNDKHPNHNYARLYELGNITSPKLNFWKYMSFYVMGLNVKYNIKNKQTFDLIDQNAYQLLQEAIDEVEDTIKEKVVASTSSGTAAAPTQEQKETKEAKDHKKDKHKDKSKDKSKTKSKSKQKSGFFDSIKTIFKKSNENYPVRYVEEEGTNRRFYELQDPKTFAQKLLVNAFQRNMDSNRLYGIANSRDVSNIFNEKNENAIFIDPTPDNDTNYARPPQDKISILPDEAKAIQVYAQQYNIKTDNGWRTHLEKQFQNPQNRKILLNAKIKYINDENRTRTRILSTNYSESKPYYGYTGQQVYLHLQQLLNSNTSDSKIDASVQSQSKQILASPVLHITSAIFHQYGIWPLDVTEYFTIISQIACIREFMNYHNNIYPVYTSSSQLNNNNLQQQTQRVLQENNVTGTLRAAIRSYKDLYQSKLNHLQMSVSPMINKLEQLLNKLENNNAGDKFINYISIRILDLLFEIGYFIIYDSKDNLANPNFEPMSFPIPSENIPDLVRKLDISSRARSNANKSSQQQNDEVNSLQERINELDNWISTTKEIFKNNNKENRQYTIPSSPVQLNALMNDLTRYYPHIFNTNTLGHMQSAFRDLYPISDPSIRTSVCLLDYLQVDENTATNNPIWKRLYNVKQGQQGQDVDMNQVELESKSSSSSNTTLPRDVIAIFRNCPYATTQTEAYRHAIEYFRLNHSVWPTQWNNPNNSTAEDPLVVQFHRIMTIAQDAGILPRGLVGVKLVKKQSYPYENGKYLYSLVVQYVGFMDTPMHEEWKQLFDSNEAPEIRIMKIQYQAAIKIQHRIQRLLSLSCVSPSAVEQYIQSNPKGDISDLLPVSDDLSWYYKLWPKNITLGSGGLSEMFNKTSNDMVRNVLFNIKHDYKYSLYHVAPFDSGSEIDCIASSVFHPCFSSLSNAIFSYYNKDWYSYLPGKFGVHKSKFDIQREVEQLDLPTDDVAINKIQAIKDLVPEAVYLAALNPQLEKWRANQIELLQTADARNNLESLQFGSYNNIMKEGQDDDLLSLNNKRFKFLLQQQNIPRHILYKIALRSYLDQENKDIIFSFLGYDPMLFKDTLSKEEQQAYTYFIHGWTKNDTKDITLEDQYLQDNNNAWNVSVLVPEAITNKLSTITTTTTNEVKVESEKDKSMDVSMNDSQYPAFVEPNVAMVDEEPTNNLIKTNDQIISTTTDEEEPIAQEPDRGEDEEQKEVDAFLEQISNSDEEKSIAQEPDRGEDEEQKDVDAFLASTNGKQPDTIIEPDLDLDQNDDLNMAVTPNQGENKADIITLVNKNTNKRKVEEEQSIQPKNDEDVNMLLDQQLDKVIEQSPPKAKNKNKKRKPNNEDTSTVSFDNPPDNNPGPKNPLFTINNISLEEKQFIERLQGNEAMQKLHEQFAKIVLQVWPPEDEKDTKPSKESKKSKEPKEPKEPKEHKKSKSKQTKTKTKTEHKQKKNKKAKQTNNNNTTTTSSMIDIDTEEEELSEEEESDQNNINNNSNNNNNINNNSNNNVNIVTDEPEEEPDQESEESEPEEKNNYDHIVISP